MLDIALVVRTAALAAAGLFASQVLALAQV
jgi:hypothetical protein